MNHSSFIFKNQLITAFFCSLLAMATAIISSPATMQKQPEFELPKFADLDRNHSVTIVIPAYNEENRIESTLHAYIDYFSKIKKLKTTFLVVCNNCSDNTVNICKRIKKNHPELHYMDLKPGGKGFAIKQGFTKALDYKTDFIGFVDADMSTTPPYFYELITKIKKNDGINASRYSKDSRTWPNRPFVKRVGGNFYNWMLRHNYHLDIRDTQCGAKLFTNKTIQTIAPHMQEKGWAFELELFYLCQLFDKKIIEIPTTWIDAPGSHLTISGSYKEFLTAPMRIKKVHKNLAHKLREENIKKKRSEQAKAKALQKSHKKMPKRFA